MDVSEKLEQKEQTSGCNKVRWLVVAVVTLTMGLVAVTTVMSLMAINSLPGQRALIDHHEEATISRAVHGESANAEATVNFYHKNDVEIIVTREGKLTATLFDQGLMVTNDVTTGDCYLMKVDTNEAQGREEETLLEKSPTEELNVTATTVVKMRSKRPMSSEELTILPQFVRNHCKEDTYWVREQTQEETSLVKTKRGWFRRAVRRVGRALRRAVNYVKEKVIPIVTSIVRIGRATYKIVRKGGKIIRRIRLG